jgi:hypothetical protein
MCEQRRQPSSLYNLLILTLPERCPRGSKRTVRESHDLISEKMIASPTIDQMDSGLNIPSSFHVRYFVICICLSSVTSDVSFTSSILMNSTLSQLICDEFSGYSLLECSLLCSRKPGCHYFHFHERGGVCQIGRCPSSGCSYKSNNFAGHSKIYYRYEQTVCTMYSICTKLQRCACPN